MKFLLTFILIIVHKVFKIYKYKKDIQHIHAVYLLFIKCIIDSLYIYASNKYSTIECFH